MKKNLRPIIVLIVGLIFGIPFYGLAQELSEEEKQKAILQLKNKCEITRFKGLGEISPEEFEGFIGEQIRLSPVIINDDKEMKGLLDYYMGKNTQERQDFIIANLRIEKDEVEQTIELEVA